MYATIHNFGTSFLGIAQYVLHDEGKAKTSDRVGWVETRNLGTQDGELAARVMAATAMSQNDLKAQAGIKNTGRRSAKHVMHYTLGWAPDETKHLSKDEMLRAVNQSLHALGNDGTKTHHPRRQLAADHQALVVCHQEKGHLHVHVVVNRVHPEHGVMLPSSQDQNKLQSWALQYEKERGHLYFPARDINAKARERGEWIRAQKRLPRNQYEALLTIDAAQGHTKAVIEAENQKDAAIYERRRDLLQLHAEQSEALESKHKARKATLAKLSDDRTRKAREAVQKAFRAKWEALYQQHLTQKSRFERNEQTLRGRITNAIHSLQFKWMVRGENRLQSLTHGFQVWAGRGPREQLLLDRHKTEENALHKEQDLQTQKKLDAIKDDAAMALRETRQLFAAEHNHLALSQRMDWAKHHAEWSKRNLERRETFQALMAERSPLSHDPEAPQPNWIDDAIDQGNHQTDVSEEHEEDYGQ